MDEMERKERTEEMKNAEEDGWVVVNKEEKEEERVKKEEESKEDLAMEEEDDDDDDDDDDDEEKNEKMEFVLDLELLRKSFTPGPNNEVSIPSYIKAYSELKKFIRLLGPLFHFVAYDVTRKVSILRKKQAKEHGENYMDLRKMLQYETSCNIIKGSSRLSGSNALLQLHRGLDFTYQFMKELLKDDEEALPLGQAASQIYLNTTGRFHHTILAKTFSGILLLMPDRSTIASRVSKGSDEAQERLRMIMPDVIQAVTDTYNACENLYKEFDALDIDGLDGRRRNQE